MPRLSDMFFDKKWAIIVFQSNSGRQFDIFSWSIHAS